MITRNRRTNNQRGARMPVNRRALWHMECDQPASLRNRVRNSSEEWGGRMTAESLRDVTHVLDNLSPEQNKTLDEWAGQVQGVLNTAVEQGGPAARRVKNWLNGVWLDHPLHPALTDFTIGAW